MLLIPAIDLKDGKCVRLRQGEMDDVTVFSDNPVEVAERWVAQGARRLHIVDLDGAATGRPVHSRIISEIVARHPDIPIQVGGGIRTDEGVQTYIEAGAEYVILGSKAVSAPHFVEDMCLEFPEHIIVGLDARNGRVAVDGWSKLSHHTVEDLAERFQNDGVSAIVFTDIGQDGMMSGANIDATVRLAQSVAIPVIASGGVSCLEDIKALKAVEDEGVMGAILGRALYEGALDLAAAQQLADSEA